MVRLTPYGVFSHHLFSAVRLESGGNRTELTECTFFCTFFFGVSQERRELHGQYRTDSQLVGDYKFRRHWVYGA